jgi:protein-disulfide isomerase
VTEFPAPVRLPGEYPPPVAVEHPQAVPWPPDDDSLFGAEGVAASVARRIAGVRVPTVGARLTPPFGLTRDHVDGPVSARVTLVVFGAYGTPASRPLGALLSDLRARHLTTLRVAWRHFPNPPAHPRAVVFALAAEAAAARGKFWGLTRELLALKHDDPVDLHHALVRAGLDPGRTLTEMRAMTGAGRIVDDTTSALASGVTLSPALFIGRERYHGELTAAAVSAALEPALAGGRG